MKAPSNAATPRLRAVRTAEAKNRLSELLAHVRRGTRYRIFDRDTPVADLVPVGDWRTREPRGDEAAQRRRLIEQGVIRAGEAVGTPREILRRGPRLARGSAVAVLLEERKASP